MVGAFTEAGRLLGLAFQAVDDLLGIWGDPRSTGKPAGSDLRSRKRTLPVVMTLTGDTAAARHLAGLLGEPGEMTEERTRRAAAVIEEAGGRSRTLAEGRRCLALARETLLDVPLRPRTWRELTAVSDYLVGRTR
ncbi:polyprenyl synthetase family protein [Streptomyces sp. RFCAC02]|uniref:polyprenyl synthetase family protein n=1 Tax=Streptomyces sp. RFCAC02 TaxID=2499143 RepID=UPI003207BA56